MHYMSMGMGDGTIPKSDNIPKPSILMLQKV